MMFVKIYRYHIQPDKTDEFIKVQERASKIYGKYMSYRSVYLRDREKPGLWLEIQWCRDEDTYRRAMDSINAEPEIERLWQEFQALLDPNDRAIQEEYYEQVHSEGDL